MNGNDDPYLAPLDPATKVHNIAQQSSVSPDVADDYLKVAHIESGQKQGVRVSPKGARGFGQVMPDVKGGTVRTVGNQKYDLTDEAQNIEAGLRYFNEGGDDPVARRLHYFGGPKASSHYQRTGRIPNINDGNMTAAQYVKATGGQQQPEQQDPYLAPLKGAAPVVPDPSTDDPYLAPLVQQPALKTPKVTSSVKEADTGTEIPTRPAPLKFEPADPDKESSLNTLAKSSQDIADTVKMQGMTMPKNHPDLLGKHVEVRFDHQPTAEEADDAMMEQMGKGYGALAKQFREETGRGFTVGQTAVQKQPNGSYVVHARPTQGFIDAVNAYALGGRKAYDATLGAQTTGRAAVARDVQTAQKQGEGVAQDLGQAGAREALKMGQFVQNASDIAPMVARLTNPVLAATEALTGKYPREVDPETDPNAQAIARAEQSIPQSKTWTGAAANAALGTGGVITRAEALGGGPAFPLEQALENVHRGPEATYKAGILAAPIVALGPIGQAAEAQAAELGVPLSAAQRQVILRTGGAAGLAGSAAAGGGGPKDIIGGAITGGAFPTGKQSEPAEPRRPLDIENAPRVGVPGKATANTDQTLAAREAGVKPPVSPDTVDSAISRERLMVALKGSKPVALPTEATRPPTATQYPENLGVVGPTKPVEGVQEGTKLNRWQHRDLGVVTEIADQSGVGKGKVRVLDEKGDEHIIQRSKGTGAGNQIAIPLRDRPPTNQELDAKAQAAENEPLKVTDRRSQSQPEPMADPFGRLRESADPEGEFRATVPKEQHASADKLATLIEKPKTGALYGKLVSGQATDSEVGQFRQVAKDSGVSDSHIEAVIGEGKRQSAPKEPVSNTAQRTSGAVVPGTAETAGRSVPDFVRKSQEALDAIAARKASGVKLMHAGADPYELYHQVVVKGWELYDQKVRPTFEEWSRKLRDEFGPQANDHIKAAWAQFTGEQSSNTSQTPATTGIAQRVEESRRSTMNKESARTGEGISAQDSVERGRQLLSEGKRPEQAVSDFKRTGTISSDSVALVRARHEELARAANKAFDDGGHKLTDPKFQAAEKARQDWWEKAVKPMQTEWHKTGMAQQGETAIDTGTFYGLYRAFKQRTGREMTPKESQAAAELTKKVAGSDRSVRSVESELIDRLNQASGIKDLPRDVQGALKKFIDESRRESRTQKRQQTRKTLDDEAATIKQNIAAEFARLKTQAGKNTTLSQQGLGLLDPNGVITKELVKYAKNRAKAGLTDASQLIDDAHSMLKEFANVTKRQVAEALTGIGIPKREITKNEWAKVKQNIQKGLKGEDATKEQFNLQQRVKAGVKISPEDAKTIWRYARDRYIDKGVEFGDAVQNVAKDLGANPNQIRRALGEQSGSKPLTDELYRRMSARRQARTAAEAWVANADKPPAVKALENLRDVFFNIKTFGHGTVGPITHAGKNLFIPERWADYFKNVGRTWKAAYSSSYHERLMQDLINDPNYTTARRAGLANEPGKFYDDYQNSQMQKIFGAVGKIGNRGFDVLKTMRQDFFNSQWNKLDDIQKTPEMAKAVADIANHATGAIRSRLPFSGLTRGVFFAPSLEGSRWATLIGDPARAINAFTNWGKAAPEEKYFAKQVVSKHAQFLGTYLAALALNQGILSASKSDDKINFTDPSKGDWLRFKIAGRSIEPTGGIIGTIDFLGKLAMASVGPKRPGETRYETMGKAVAQYGRGKLSPLGSTVADVTSQADFAGRPMPFSSDKGTESKPKYSWPEYLLTQHTPIPMSEAVRDIQTNLQKQGVDESKTKAVIKGLMVGAISGGTGVRIGGEYSPNPKEGRKDFRQMLTDRLRKGEDVSKETDKALSEDKLTVADAKRIEKDSQLTVPQAAFHNTSPKSALYQYEQMNESERADVRDMMEKKAWNLTHSDALTEMEKKVNQRRLDKLGIEPTPPRANPFGRLPGISTPKLGIPSPP